MPNSFLRKLNLSLLMGLVNKSTNWFSDQQIELRCHHYSHDLIRSGGIFQCALFWNVALGSLLGLLHWYCHKVKEF